MNPNTCTISIAYELEEGGSLWQSVVDASTQARMPLTDQQIRAEVGEISAEKQIGGPDATPQQRDNAAHFLPIGYEFTVDLDNAPCAPATSLAPESEILPEKVTTPPNTTSPSPTPSAVGDFFLKPEFTFGSPKTQTGLPMPSATAEVAVARPAPAETTTVGGGELLATIAFVGASLIVLARRASSRKNNNN